MSLMKNPTNPMTKKPTPVATAIFLNSKMKRESDMLRECIVGITFGRWFLTSLDKSD
jgi:hypothetical protein